MSKILNTIKLFCLLAILITSLSACVKNIRVRGFSSNITTIETLQDKIKNKQDALNLLGSPSTISILGEEKWYYITTKEEYYAFLTPIIIEQKSIELKFDQNGKLLNMNYYDSHDKNNFELNQDYTPTEGDNKSIIKTIFGNLGKFNKNERKAQVKKPI